ncbi:YcjF family protein [Pleomorphomonas sp. PLEO]|uniref:YcjF family protein n=1 Tax=Pleomorphomonas sp. PLEO TaxID=3239306 RepID=UPI00351F00A7
MTRRPTAFDLSADDVSHVRPGEAPSSDATVIVEEAVEAEDLPVPLLPVRRRFAWSRLFFGAVAGILSMAVGLWLDQLVRELFARDDWLGWLAIALIALAVIAVVAIAVREIAGLIWLRRIDRMRRRADLAAARDDRPEAEAVVSELVTLYADRPELALGRRATEARVDDIIDGRDRLVLAEADLLAPLDAAARRLVSDAAARVSVVTAVSPRAAVDVIFVVVATLGLIRRLAALYGGRPGFMGMARLTRLVLTHLAVTGSIAVGDGLAQQLIGHGLAAKLSARLGEGVINGLLTARVGVAAIDVCRPLPFLERRRPQISEIMAGIRAPRAK